jgi:hypothetical protein
MVASQAFFFIGESGDIIRSNYENFREFGEFANSHKRFWGAKYIKESSVNQVLSFDQ